MRDGKTVPFSESDRAAVRRSVTELSDQALRVLAFARQEDGACVFLGLAGMLDPPRESARPPPLRIRQDCSGAKRR